MPLLAHLRLVRWPGAVTAAVNAMTGFLVAHRMTTREDAIAACAAAAGGAIVYAGGVVLNDVADAERDATLHPRRPIPAGDVTRTSAARFGFALLVAGAAVSMLLAGPWAGAATAAAGLFAALYDFGAKRGRIPGAVVLGLARAANALAGALAGCAALSALDPQRLPYALQYAAAVFAYTALLTFASTFEERTPSKAAAGTFAIALFVTAALPWSVFFAEWHAGPAPAYALLLATLLIAAREAAEPQGPGMGALVRCGVFGFLLADAAWICGVGRYAAGFALLVGWIVLRFALSRSRS